MKPTNNFNFPVSQTLKEFLPEPFIDDDGAGTKYVGYAPLGVAETEAGWRIVKFEKVGNVTKALYPDGSDSFKYKWSERASLTYSR